MPVIDWTETFCGDLTQLPNMHLPTVLRTLKFQDTQVQHIFDGKLLKRLRVITTRKSPKNLEDQNTVVELSFQDGKKQLVPCTLATFNEAVEKLQLKTDLLIENTFVSLSDSKESFSEWQLARVDQYYMFCPKNVQLFYDVLHQVLATTISEVILKEKIREAKIITLGTGDGNDLREVMQKLLDAGVSVSGLGFDFNDSNIELAKESEENKNFKSIQFYSADTLRLYDLYSRTRILHHNQGTNKIMIFCGSMTRQVLNDTKEGLSVLQQLYHCNPDLAFFAGLCTQLFTRAMVKRVGFDYSYLEHEVFDLYQLKKTTTDDRKAWLIKQYHKDPQSIDLSMSAAPIDDLQYLFNSGVDCTLIKSIILKWVFIKDKGDLDYLLCVLAQFNKPTIVYNHDHPFLQKFSYFKVENGCDFQPIYHTSTYEVLPFSSRFINRHQLNQNSHCFWSHAPELKKQQMMMLRQQTIFDLDDIINIISSEQFKLIDLQKIVAQALSKEYMGIFFRNNSHFDEFFSELFQLKYLSEDEISELRTSTVKLLTDNKQHFNQYRPSDLAFLNEFFPDNTDQIKRLSTKSDLYSCQLKF